MSTPKPMLQPKTPTDSVGSAADLTADLPGAPPGSLFIHCERCHSRSILQADRPLDEAVCEHCGSRLSLAAEQTQDWSVSGGGAGAAAAPRKTIGHFELMELLGSGGFGAVWKARDLQLDRLVAVKIPHKGRLSLAEVERFLREARAAAQLRHPNIVSVHEVGLADDFVYIVSDFIDGLSLDAWLSDQRPSYRDSARLCAKVGEALHHAHQQGIVHRDLKPGNILMDREGEPHVTDFGLAKRETVQAVMTIEGQVFGTPAYMSPEQARGQGHAADRRTDVYSLGAVLFEMLTGEHPFRGNVQMILKQVIEDEPPSPRKFDARVPRDLETICLKCLQKEPSSRYATALEFRDELHRYLAGMPILARPVGRLERLGRWCRRNPLVASSIAAAVACLLFGLIASTVGYVQASRALARSEESLSQARRAVDELFTRVSEETLLKTPGMQPLRRDLLRRARDYYEEFLSHSASDASLLDEAAKAHFRVGLITEEIESPAEAVPYYEKAEAIQARLAREEPDNAERLKALGDTLNAEGRAMHKQQRFEPALKAYAAAVEARKRLAERSPENVEYQRTLANTYMNVGLAEKRSDPARARESMERAQAIRGRLLDAGETDPGLRRDFAKGCYNLAMLALDGNDAAEAEADLQKAVAGYSKLIQEGQADFDTEYALPVCYRKQADILCSHKKYDEALALYAQAREALEKLAEKNPTVAEFQIGAAEVFINIAQLESERGQADRSLAAFDRAARLLTPLIASQAADARFRNDLLLALCSVGELHPDAGRRAEAVGALETLGERLRRIAADSPGAPQAAEHEAAIREALRHFAAAGAAEPQPPKKP